MKIKYPFIRQTVFALAMWLIGLPISLTGQTVPLYRVNAGGPAIESLDDGVDWESDNFFNPSVYLADAGSNGLGGFFITQVTDSVDLTSVPISVFRTERFDQPGDSAMRYSFPLLNGAYSVRLYMANGWEFTSNPGERIFSVSLEGVVPPSLEDIDLTDQFGHQVGTVITNTVNVTDGSLDIVFLHGIAQNPLINGIEILGDAAAKPLVINALEDLNNNVGDEILRSISVKGGNPEETVTLAISGQPAGIDILDNEEGTFGGTLAAGAEIGGPNNDGVYTVIVSATQPSSPIVRDTFIWKVFPEGSDFLDSWVAVQVQGANSHTARTDNGFVQVGNRFYLVGGRTTGKSLEIFNPETYTWSLGAFLPVALSSFQAVEYQGYLWVAGAFEDVGVQQFIPASNIYIYDPAKNRWYEGPAIPKERRRGAAATAVYEGKIYLIGGNINPGQGGFVPWLDVYDPATNSWTELPDAPSARDHFSAVTQDGKIYAIGGRQTGGAGGVYNPVLETVDVFDVDAGVWTTLPAPANLPTPRGNASVVPFNDEIFVIGGEIDDAPVQDALPTTESFDPQTNTWTPRADLNFKRQGTQAISSGGGIFLTAGSPVLGPGSQTQMEFYGEWEPSLTMLVPSSLEKPFVLFLESGGSEDLTLTAARGNQGIFIESFSISGPDADKFSITSGDPESFLIGANSSYTLEISLEPNSDGARAQLDINLAEGGKRTVELVAGLPVPTPVFINSGGPDFRTSTGDLFREDRNFVSEFSSTFENVVSIQNTEDDSLYQTERFGNFEYQIPLANGNYFVDLHFAEIFLGTSPGSGSGDRVFSVFIEEELALDSFDIFDEVGARFALIKTFEDVEVTDDTLNIKFVSQIDLAKVSAIGVIPENNLPVVSPVAGQNNREGEPVNIQVLADDGDNGFQSLTYSAINLPPGLTIDPATGVISGTLKEGTRAQNFTDGAAADSPYNVSILVSDNGRPVLSGTTSFEWVVLPKELELQAQVKVIPGAVRDAGTEGGQNKITIVNNSDVARINSIRIDLSTAILPDLVFDPDGEGGDGVGQCFTPVPALADASGLEDFQDPCTDPFSQPKGGGFQVLELSFTDFKAGDSIQFSVDVDPNSLQGLTDVAIPAKVSGLEWAGATISVTFEDLSTLTAQFFEEGSPGGGQAVVLETPLSAPTLSVAGVTPPADTASMQTIQVEISGTPGLYATLLHANAAFNVNGQTPFNVTEPYLYGNRILAYNRYSTQLDDQGQGTIEIELFPSELDDIAEPGGINYLLAAQTAVPYANAQGEIGNTSDPLVLRLEPQDTDGDGIVDFRDNCPLNANADQEDQDADGVGDVCDNCPTEPNADQELFTFFLDEDQDGFGTPDSTIQDCQAPQGFVANSNDCDDTNPFINPGALEVAGDGIDQNCDGSDLIVDQDMDGFPDNFDNCPENFNPNQEDADMDGVGDICDNCVNVANPDQAIPVYWLDLDGDGYGDSTFVNSCDGGQGLFLAEELVGINGDCNDNNANINPDAIEIANDLIDQNCDGLDSFRLVDDVRLSARVEGQPSFEPGTNFDLTFFVDAGSQPFNEVNLLVLYDADVIEVRNFSLGNSLNLVTLPLTFNNNTGALDFGAVLNQGTLTGSHDIITVTFEMMTADSAIIDFMTRGSGSDVVLGLNSVSPDAPDVVVNGTITTSVIDRDGVLREALLFPNPVVDQLNLSIQGKAGEEIWVRVFDTRGKEIYRLNRTLAGKAETIQLNQATHEIPAGIYYVQIRSENFIYPTLPFVRH